MRNNFRVIAATSASRSRQCSGSLGLVLSVLAICPPIAFADSVDFRRDIQPLLTQRCLNCHGPKKQKGGLRLDLKTAAFKG